MIIYVITNFLIKSNKPIYGRIICRLETTTFLTIIYMRKNTIIWQLHLRLENSLKLWKINFCRIKENILVWHFCSEGPSRNFVWFRATSIFQLEANKCMKIHEYLAYPVGILCVLNGLIRTKTRKIKTVLLPAWYITWSKSRRLL